MRIISVFLICALAIHCKSSEVTFFEKQDINRETFNSIIEGELLSLDKELTTDLSSEHPCSKEPCFGQVRIKKILQKGQNYHGQFEEGQILNVYFEFTLENTRKNFPELNKALAGLKKGDIFEAELFEKQDLKQKYSVKLYALSN